MPVKQYKPTSPGRRQGSVIDYKAVLTKFEPRHAHLGYGYGYGFEYSYER